MPIKKTLLDAQNLALSKKGECLSDTYVNNYTNLTWRCAKGHTWTARYSSISSNGSWCPHCLKSTIEEMQKIAALKKGFFLDEIYVNSHTKHNWKCIKGHVWQQYPPEIKAGRWCPICTKENPIIKYGLILNKENIREIRIQNILKLILHYTTQQKLAAALNVSRIRIVHYKKGLIGERASRNIEKTLGLPDKYMDEFHEKFILDKNICCISKN